MDTDRLRLEQKERTKQRGANEQNNSENGGGDSGVRPHVASMNL